MSAIEPAAASVEQKASRQRFYIVFSPDGDAPAKRVHGTHKEAYGVAWNMAKMHPGQDFFVMMSTSKPLRKDVEAAVAVAA